jgi:hypothetical protein
MACNGTALLTYDVTEPACRQAATHRCSCNLELGRSKLVLWSPGFDLTPAWPAPRPGRLLEATHCQSNKVGSLPGNANKKNVKCLLCQRRAEHFDWKARRKDITV